MQGDVDGVVVSDPATTMNTSAGAHELQAMKRPGYVRRPGLLCARASCVPE